jgi:hypothetical protein
MPKYLFTYCMPLAAYQAPAPVSQDEAMAPWVAFFAAMDSSVVDPGQPVAERTELGEVGRSTVLAGYSLVDAADLEAATALAANSPSVGQGGGVEVGMLIDLPA